MKSDIENAQILMDIAGNPAISQREIATKHGISLGKVNYAIKALVDKGFIKLQNFSESPNKRKYLYILTQQGIYEKARLTAAFFKHKMEEYERLTREVEALKEEMARQEVGGVESWPPETADKLAEKTG